MKIVKWLNHTEDVLIKDNIKKRIFNAYTKGNEECDKARVKLELDIQFEKTAKAEIF